MRKVEQLAAPRRGLFVPDATSLYVRPLNLSCEGISRCADINDADRLLGGGPNRFQRIEVILRTNERIRAFSGPIDNMRDWAVKDGCLEDIDAAIFRLTRRRGKLQGRSWGRPLVVGIVNVTPDSFSDGVDRSSPHVAISHAHALIEAGADLLDIGGIASFRAKCNTVFARICHDMEFVGKVSTNCAAVRLYCLCFETKSG